MTDKYAIAERIIATDPYGMRDADATPEAVIESIESTPYDVINYLLDMIDDLLA